MNSQNRTLTWKGFKEAVFPDGKPTGIRVSYVQEDGREVTIQSEADFNEAVKFAKKNGNRISFVLLPDQDQKYETKPKHHQPTYKDKYPANMGNASGNASANAMQQYDGTYYNLNHPNIAYSYYGVKPPANAPAGGIIKVKQPQFKGSEPLANQEQPKEVEKYYYSPDVLHSHYIGKDGTLIPIKDYGIPQYPGAHCWPDAPYKRLNYIIVDDEDDDDNGYGEAKPNPTTKQLPGSGRQANVPPKKAAPVVNHSDHVPSLPIIENCMNCPYYAGVDDGVEEYYDGYNEVAGRSASGAPPAWFHSAMMKLKTEILDEIHYTIREEMRYNFKAELKAANDRSVEKYRHDLYSAVKKTRAEAEAADEAETQADNEPRLITKTFETTTVDVSWDEPDVGRKNKNDKRQGKEDKFPRSKVYPKYFLTYGHDFGPMLKRKSSTFTSSISMKEIEHLQPYAFWFLLGNNGNCEWSKNVTVKSFYHTEEFKFEQDSIKLPDLDPGVGVNFVFEVTPLKVGLCTFTCAVFDNDVEIGQRIVCRFDVYERVEGTNITTAGKIINDETDLNIPTKEAASNKINEKKINVGTVDDPKQDADDKIKIGQKRKFNKDEKKETGDCQDDTSAKKEIEKAIEENIFYDDDDDFYDDDDEDDDYDNYDDETYDNVDNNIKELKQKEADKNKQEVVDAGKGKAIEMGKRGSDSESSVVVVSEGEENFTVLTLPSESARKSMQKQMQEDAKKEGKNFDIHKAFLSKICGPDGNFTQAYEKKIGGRKKGAVFTITEDEIEFNRKIAEQIVYNGKYVPPKTTKKEQEAMKGEKPKTAEKDQAPHETTCAELKKKFEETHIPSLKLYSAATEVVTTFLTAFNSLQATLAKENEDVKSGKKTRRELVLSVRDAMSELLAMGFQQEQKNRELLGMHKCDIPSMFEERAKDPSFMKKTAPQKDMPKDPKDNVQDPNLAKKTPPQPDVPKDSGHQQ